MSVRVTVHCRLTVKSAVTFLSETILKPATSPSITGLSLVNSTLSNGWGVSSSVTLTVWVVSSNAQPVGKVPESVRVTVSLSSSIASFSAVTVSAKLPVFAGMVRVLLPEL